MSNNSAPNVGITNRAVSHLFEHMSTTSSTCILSLSYVEVYNEEVRDLLHSDVSPKDIHIREDSSGGVQIVGIEEERVESLSQMEKLLERASVRRMTAGTRVHEHSSRSHSIVTISLEQVNDDQGSQSYRSAKLSLVDLAGSERAKKTGNIGLRFKESVAINSGLLALGNVVSALGDGRRRGHVPYRQSKLTRLLQNALGGNSKTVLIACVSPSEDSLEESVNTLQYANRARNIRNCPVPNTTQIARLVQRKKIDEEESVHEALFTAVTERDSIQRRLTEAQALLHASEPFLRAITDSLALCDDRKEEARLLLAQFATQTKVHAEQYKPTTPSRHYCDDDDERVARAVKAAESAELLAAELETELTTTRQQLNQSQKDLADAREDLARDEEIFAEKLHEIKELQTQMKQHEAETSGLRRRLEQSSRPLSAASILKQSAPPFESPSKVVGTARSSSQRLASHMEGDDDVRVEDDDWIRPDPQKEIQSLGVAIRLKEELIRQMVRNEKPVQGKMARLERKKAEAEKIARKLEVEVKELTRDHDALAESLLAVQSRVQELEALEGPKGALDGEMKQIVKHREALKQLEKTVKEKEEALLVREQVLAQKELLTKRKMIVRQSITAVNDHIQSLLASQPDDQALNAAYDQRSRLEISMDSKELEDVDVKLLALDTQLTVKEAKIEELNRVPPGKVREVIDKLNGDEGKALLRHYLDRLVTVDQSFNEHEKKVKQLTAVASKQTEQIQSLQRALQVESEASTEREASIRDVYESRIHQLVQSRSEQLAQLEKDGGYYKNLNKELKKRLKEMLIVSEKDKDRLDSERAEVKRLREQSDTLTAELGNLKSHMKLQPVRRPLTGLKVMDSTEIRRLLQPKNEC